MGSSLGAGRSDRARGGSLWPPAHLLQQHMVRRWACAALQGFSHCQWRAPQVICDIRVLGLAPGAYTCLTFLPALSSEQCLMGFSLSAASPLLLVSSSLPC